MKKIFLTSALVLSVIFVKAQTSTSYDDIYFTNLIGKQFKDVPSEHPNYKISNTLTPSGWVLDTNWWGGINCKTQGSIKLKSQLGTVFISESGNVGVNTENPLSTLDVAGSISASGNIISAGSNGWIFHSPDDGRKSLHITSIGTNGIPDWSKQTVFNEGNVAVLGKLEAKEIKVTLTPTADFVFAEDYDLPKLEDLEKHIKDKKHLPEIASAEQMEKEGVNVGEFQIKLLQKIEELTLYTIEQNKRIKELESKINKK